MPTILVEYYTSPEYLAYLQAKLVRELERAKYTECRDARKLALLANLTAAEAQLAVRVLQLRQSEAHYRAFGWRVAVDQSGQLRFIAA